MRARLLLLVLLAALLPLVAATPAPAAGTRAALVVRAPERTVGVGRTFVVRARVTGLEGPLDVRVSVREGGRWVPTGSTTSKDREHLRIRIVPTTRGRQVYRIRVQERSGRFRRLQRSIAVRAALRPDPGVSVLWVARQDAAYARVSVSVDQWIPDRPRLSLQHLADGRWITIGNASGARAGADEPWRVTVGGWVSDVGALRVVGHGMGWQVAAPVAPYYTSSGRLVVDGPAVVIPPSPSDQVGHRLVADLRAGDDLAVIADGAGVAVWDPRRRYVTTRPDLHGRGDRFSPATSGRYRIDVHRNWGTPSTLRLVRVQVATPELDGAPVVIPRAADPRVPRRVDVEATAGDLVLIYASSSAGNCTGDPALIEVGATGLLEHELDCPTADPVTVRAERVKAVDVPVDQGPVSVSADRTGQALALRFTSLTGRHTVLLDQPWIRASALFSWPGGGSSQIWTGNQQGWYDDPGPHVVVIRPPSTMTSPMSGDVTLTAVPRR